MMPTIVKLAKDFSTTHEREFWNEFVKLFEDAFSSSGELFVLLGNVMMNGRDMFDAIVIKKDAIIIIDFKDGGGEISFSEKNNWLRGDGSEIKGGSFPNPYLQVRFYKFKLMDFFNEKIKDFEGLENANFGHITGIVLFREKIIFENNQLPGNLKPWFHITDKGNVVQKIKDVTSKTINLSDELLKQIPTIFGIGNNDGNTIPFIAAPVLVNYNRIPKQTEVERILDYYITCLEQEELKQLTLKAELQNGQINNHGTSYHFLQTKWNIFFTLNQNNATIQFVDNSETTFITNEIANPNPRNLFIGYPVMSFTNQRNEIFIYPKYYCQLVLDDDTNTYKRLNDNECILNKYFLKRAGISDSEEIESIVDEINSINSFNEKEIYLIKNNIINEDSVNDFPILFFSGVSGILNNLIKELSDLMRPFHLNQIQNTKAKYLIDGDRIIYNGIVQDLDNKVEIFRLNNSQGKGVYNSLTKKFTVITGPPGTGKSQVVLNILANAIMQDKKVLFASKNNKAVDVVRERLLNEVFANEPELKDLITRIGSKDEMKNAITQFGRIINNLNDGNYNIDDSKLKDSLKDLTDINEQLREKQNLLSETKKFIDDVKEIEKYDYSIQSAFFGTEELNFNDTELSFDINEMNRIRKKNDLNILEKILLWIYPRFFFNKYFKKLKGYKNQLPELVKKYFENQITFEKYSLEELLKGFDELKNLKAKELKIKSLKEFVLRNNVESILKVDLKNANTFLSIFKIQSEEDIYNIKTVRIEKSRIAFKNKLKQIIITNGNTNLIESFKSSCNRLFVLNNIPSAEFPTFMNDHENYARDIVSLLPIWMVTSLSVRFRLPLERDLFDLVVIDEASQCDIPSAIPLFYRAKSVCIIGDDLQLKHISGIKLEEDFKIAEECGVPHVGGRYTENSLFTYSLEICNKSNISDIFLDEHYRSCKHIMDFSNLYFYLPKKNRQMIHKTNVNNLNFSKQGVFWIDTTSNGATTKYKSNNIEIDKIIELYKRLTENNLNNNISFGITTPFRNQSDKINNKLVHEQINRKNDVKVLGDNVHKFQGDEKDVIFFSPVISFEATNGMKNFINYNSPQLLNVAISRGRSAVIIVGDRNACANAGGLLRHLVNHSTLISENKLFN